MASAHKKIRQINRDTIREKGVTLCRVTYTQYVFGYTASQEFCGGVKHVYFYITHYNRFVYLDISF